MSCCVASTYGNWCSELPTIPYGEKNYCVFHAPSEAPDKPKGKRFKEFLGFVLKSIDKCRLDGTVFPDDISINLGYQNKPLHLSSCRFEGDVSITGEVVLSLCLSESIFLKGLSFGEPGVKSCHRKHAKITSFLATKRAKEHDVKLKVGTDLLLDGVEIEGTLNLKNCSIGGALRLCDTVIRERTNLASTEVGGCFDMTGATFLDRVQMNDAEVTGKAVFDKTRFEEECRITQSVFKEGGIFSSACFHGTLLIQKTRFDNKVWFEKVEFNGASFPLSHFGGTAIFNEVDLKSVSLLNAPIEDFCFLGCSWLEHRGRAVTCDLSRLETPKKYRKINKMAVRPKPLGESDIYTSPGALAELYRRLKKLARTESDELLASDWHYLEKEMLRDHIQAEWPIFGGFAGFCSKSFLWAILGCYRACSGYGESPARALIALILLIGFTCTIPLVLEVTPGKHVDPVLEAAWFLPLSKVDITNLSGWSYWLKWVISTLITAQGALFVFALRNKLRR